MKPVCRSCDKEYVVSRVGVAVLETMTGGLPYKLYLGDMLQCPECGHEIIHGFGNPIGHFDGRFDERLKDEQDSHNLVATI